MEEIKISKNNVSYFIAGYKAALASTGYMKPKEIEAEDYTTVEFSNNIKNLLRAYDSEEYDKEGMIEIYKLIKK